MNIIDKVALTPNAHLHSLELANVVTPQHVLPLTVIVYIKERAQCFAGEGEGEGIVWEYQGRDLRINSRQVIVASTTRFR